MKKIIALFITIMILMSACQPTPEELIVQNKADGELMDKIEATAVENTATAAPIYETTQENVQEETKDVGYKVIGHETFEQTLVNGMHLVADADVEIPDTEKFPIIKFRRKEFSQEDFDNILNTLIGDKQLYEYDMPMTKAQIEEIILSLKLSLNKEGLSQEQIDNKKTSIEEWQRRLNEASDTPQAIEKSRQPDERGRIHGLVDFKENMYARLEICPDNPNRSTTDDQIGIRYSILGKENRDSLWTKLQSTRHLGELIETQGAYDEICIEPVENAEGNISMTPGEAISLAEDTFHGLGAGDDIWVSDIFYLYVPEGETSPAEDIHCYAVELKRHIGNAPIQVTFSNNQGMERRSNDGSDEFNSNLPYESMSVFISDDGIVDLEWREPLEAVEVMNENVELVPYEKIIEVFNQEFVNSYSTYFWRTENEAVENKGLRKTFTYEANDVCSLYSIKLNYGMARMPNQNNYYMAIPLWDFYASYVVRSWEGTDPVSDNVMERIFDFDMMTINAIDKSRFSRQWGY